MPDDATAGGVSVYVFHRRQPVFVLGQNAGCIPSGRQGNFESIPDFPLPGHCSRVVGKSNHFADQRLGLKFEAHIMEVWEIRPLI
jgi:hypothetical protein